MPVSTSSGLRIDDTVTGRGRHEIVIRWHLAPGSAVRIADGPVLVTSPAGAFSVAISATGPVRLAVETGQVAAGFVSAADAPVLACLMDAALPARVTTTWSHARGSAGEEVCGQGAT